MTQPDWLRDIGAVLPHEVRQLLVTEYTGTQNRAAETYERARQSSAEAAASAGDAESAAEHTAETARWRAQATAARRSVGELEALSTLREFIQWAQRHRTIEPARFLKKHGLIQEGRDGTPSGR